MMFLKAQIPAFQKQRQNSDSARKKKRGSTFFRVAKIHDTKSYIWKYEVISKNPSIVGGVGQLHFPRALPFFFFFAFEPRRW